MGILFVIAFMDKKKNMDRSIEPVNWFSIIIYEHNRTPREKIDIINRPHFSLEWNQENKDLEHIGASFAIFFKSNNIGCIQRLSAYR